MRPGASAIVAVGGLLLLASCGGSGSSMGPGMMSGGGTGGRGGTSTAVGGAPNGRALFLASGCGGCHALAAAGTSGSAGPDLDEASPAYGTVRSTVRQGKGAMPSYADRLTRAQIDAIARFVADAAG
jgi:mono/diheme cytochrome c family protein